VRRLYFDVAGTAQPVMLDALLKVADPTHILYGSDFPYTPVPIIARTKEALECDPLIADCVQDLFSHNAERLFGLA
jgi:predicted TIM-barrel fold metal-dependent hydrolase